MLFWSLNNIDSLAFVISPGVLVGVENEADLDRLFHPADSEWIQFNFKRRIFIVKLGTSGRYPACWLDPTYDKYK
jgi:hypothetical protein